MQMCFRVSSSNVIVVAHALIFALFEFVISSLGSKHYLAGTCSDHGGAVRTCLWCNNFGILSRQPVSVCNTSPGIVCIVVHVFFRS